MKCEACKEYDIKLEEVKKEYFAYALEGQIETLKIDRLANCKCGEIKETANEVLNSQAATVASVSSGLAKFRDLKLGHREKWSVQKLEKQGEPDYKGGERIDLFYIVDEFNETICDLYSKGLERREDGCHKLFGFENAKDNAERIVACVNASD